MKHANDYVRQQADSLFRQWDLYQNLSWRIPTVAVTINGALFAALGFLRAELGPLECAVVFWAVGALTLLCGYRHYRSSKLAQRLMLELRTRFDDEFGLKGVVRSTKYMEWPVWAQYSSRLAMSAALALWGVVLFLLGVIVLVKHLGSG